MMTVRARRFEGNATGRRTWGRAGIAVVLMVLAPDAMASPVSAPRASARAASSPPTLDDKALAAAARLRWPLLDPATEAILVANRARLPTEVRRAWAIDRALPMLAGEIPASDAVIRDVLGEVAIAAHTRAGNADMQLMAQARAAYAARDLQVAAARYATIAQGSPLWPDALRERAWTLLLLGRPGDALGATVSLKAPYFAVEDRAEAHLMKATVLLRKCRFDESRAEIAALADTALPSMSADLARQAMEKGASPALPGGTQAWNAPLVLRVRAAIATLGLRTADDPERARLVSLGTRLLTSAYDAALGEARDAKVRALEIRYESLRLERGYLEKGIALTPPKPAALPLLDDDEVAWKFDGTFWRDELGTYRYTAGDACPSGAKP